MIRKLEDNYKTVIINYKSGSKQLNYADEEERARVLFEGGVDFVGDLQGLQVRDLPGFAEGPVGVFALFQHILQEVHFQDGRAERQSQHLSVQMRKHHLHGAVPSHPKAYSRVLGVGSGDQRDMSVEWE